MKRQYWGLIAFLALILVLSVVAARAAALEVARPAGAGGPFDFDRAIGASDGTGRTPFVRAAGPDEGRRYPRGTREFVRRERFAILPDPVNGRELVDRIVAAPAGEPVRASTVRSQTPRRV